MSDTYRLGSAGYAGARGGPLRLHHHHHRMRSRCTSQVTRNSSPTQAGMAITGVSSQIWSQVTGGEVRGRLALRTHCCQGDGAVPERMLPPATGDPATHCAAAPAAAAMSIRSVFSAAAAVLSGSARFPCRADVAYRRTWQWRPRRKVPSCIVLQTGPWFRRWAAVS